MDFIAIIPARFASSRLPGKPLADIHGKPMIFHVAAGAETVLTREDHQSGTERLVEVVDLLGIEDHEVIVNVQGDEPMIEPELIIQVANDLYLHGTDVATMATPMNDTKEAANPNIVKVVLDVDGNALGIFMLRTDKTPVLSL